MCLYNKGDDGTIIILDYTVNYHLGNIENV